MTPHPMKNIISERPPGDYTQHYFLVSPFSSETPVNGGRVEAHCNTTTHFSCGDGTCLPIDKKCNGITDCPGGGDELFCVRVMYSLLSAAPLMDIIQQVSFLDVLMLYSLSPYLTFTARSL